MEYTEILVEKLDRVAKITLNRPHYRNAIGRITIEELDHAFMAAAEDDEKGCYQYTSELHVCLLVWFFEGPTYISKDCNCIMIYILFQNLII
ncbi:MAG: hypothetical protein QGH99_01365, partial [Pseudomonadales bacterium]|nr:hypothetical protein [Pseudomonadales bacterium]